jgi:hypothetical protein
VLVVAACGSPTWPYLSPAPHPSPSRLAFCLTPSGTGWRDGCIRWSECPPPGRRPGRCGGDLSNSLRGVSCVNQSNLPRDEEVGRLADMLSGGAQHPRGSCDRSRSHGRRPRRPPSPPPVRPQTHLGPRGLGAGWDAGARARAAARIRDRAVPPTTCTVALAGSKTHAVGRC